ncbi:MAG: ester cyclase [Planctomycetota bacterium]|nr:ester cyclase [Planctomycetota bacterium]
MNPGELLDNWYEQVWNQRNSDFIFKHMADDCKVDGLPREPKSPEKFLQFRDGIIRAIPDVRIEDIHSASDGDFGFAMATIVGTHKASGKKVSFRVAAHAKVENDIIVEATNVVDFQGFLNQIGEQNQDQLNKALGLG